MKYLSLPKISSEGEFEQLQELITELGREVNRCDLTIGKLPPQSRPQELLSRDPQTAGTEPRNIGEREMVPIRRRDVRSGDASH